MRQQEAAVLDALNIASTIHRRPESFEATAAQVAEVLHTDGRLANDYRSEFLELAHRQVVAYLSMLAGRGEGSRWAFGPLAEQHRPGKWRLTSAGARVLGA